MKASLGTLALVAALAIGCQSNGRDRDAHTKETRITRADVPANVMAAFNKTFPDAMVKDIEKEVHPDGTVNYEFEFEGKEGVKREVEFDADGKMLSDR